MLIIRPEMQAACDKIYYDHRAGLITRRQFKDAYDKLYFKFTDDERRAVHSRLERMFLRVGETKTLGQYALKILDNTVRESKLVALGSLIFGFTYTDMGIDNTGRLIIDNGSLTGKPDYKVNKGGLEFPVEVKALPSFTTYTIGDYQLDAYLGHDARFLVFVQEFGVIGPNGDPRLSGDYVVKTHGLWVSLTPPERMAEIRSYPLSDNRQQPGTKSYQIRGRKQIIDFFGMRLVDKR